MGWFWVLRIGVSDLHHCSRQIGKQGRRSVEGTDAGVAAVDVSAAVFSTENRPFAEDCQTVQCGGACIAYHGIGQNAIVEGHIDTVMVPVEGDWFDINVRCDQLRAADPGVGSIVQYGLGTGG